MFFFLNVFFFDFIHKLSILVSFSAFFVLILELCECFRNIFEIIMNPEEMNNSREIFIEYEL